MAMSFRPLINPVGLSRALLLSALLAVLPGEPLRSQDPAAAPPAAAPGEPDAQPAEDTRPLYEQEPFDRITLDEANKNTVLKVVPLDFPNRRVPLTPGSGSLRARLLSKPGQEFLVAWSSIKKIELFEQMVLAEGDRLTSAGQLDEAFPYYDFLRARYPDTPLLNESIQAFLYQDAGRLFRDQRYGEALGVLEELRRMNPNFQGRGGQSLLQLISAIADRFVNDYIDRGDLRSARLLIARLEADYPSGQVPAVAGLKQRLIGMATEKRDAAVQLLAGEQFKAAQLQIRELMNIWPDLEGAAALEQEIFRRYPVVAVGVTQPAPEPDVRRLDNWGARRSGRLMQRTLLEFTGPGPEGGNYVFPLGSVERSEDRLQLTFRMDPKLTAKLQTMSHGYELADRLLRLAEPSHSDYVPGWAAIARTVQVNNVFQVNVDFRRPHVLPEPLLQVRLAGGDAGAPAANASAPDPILSPYGIGSTSESVTEFVARDRAVFPGPAEIVERVYPEALQAIGALRRGDIDVIDRLFPTDALRLMAESSGSEIVVRPYALPTVHLLSPNTKHPFLANRTFRRALIYSINRDQILNQELLGGKAMAGCRLLSAPFPAPLNDNDPLAYAYDSRIEPWPYDPRLGKLLVLMATREVEEIAKKRDEPAPQLQELVLKYPAFEAARVACQAIAAQLALIGVQVKLEELPPGQTADPEGKYDLLYMELAIWEPLADAKRLLGVQGLAPADTPYVRLSLRKLDESTLWRDIYERFQELHRALFTDVTLLPLYQITDSYAYNSRLKGLADKPVYLYQSIDSWRIQTTPVQ